MTVIINSVNSLFKKGAQAVENAVHSGIAGAEADGSRIIHELKITTLAVGKDITVKFDHAAGEVKRIVINGAVTIESLFNHLTSLGAVPAPAPIPTSAPTPEPTPIPTPSPAPTSTPGA